MNSPRANLVRCTPGYCCKSPKLLGTNFLVKKLMIAPSPINRSPSSLPKSPVGLPPENEVPQISIQKSHQQPRKILVCSGKGLLQQNLPAHRTSRGARLLRLSAPSRRHSGALYSRIRRSMTHPSSQSLTTSKLNVLKKVQHHRCDVIGE